MTWLSGLVVQNQSTLHSAKLPASLLDGGELPTPWDQSDTDCIPHLLAPPTRRPSRPKYGCWLLLAAARQCSQCPQCRPSAAVNLSRVWGVCRPGRWWSPRGCQEPANIGDGRVAFDETGERRAPASESIRWESPPVQFSHQAVSRLHRLNPSWHPAQVRHAGLERRGAAISACAS